MHSSRDCESRFAQQHQQGRSSVPMAVGKKYVTTPGRTRARFDWEKRKTRVLTLRKLESQAWRWAAGW